MKTRSKCKITLTIALKHRKILKSNFYLGNDVIEQVDKYEYLGVIFYKNGNSSVWKKSVMHVKQLGHILVYENIFLDIYNQMHVKTLLYLTRFNLLQ